MHWLYCQDYFIPFLDVLCCPLDQPVFMVIINKIGIFHRQPWFCPGSWWPLCLYSINQSEKSFTIKVCDVCIASRLFCLGSCCKFICSSLKCFKHCLLLLYPIYISCTIFTKLIHQSSYLIIATNSAFVIFIFYYK